MNKKKLVKKINYKNLTLDQLIDQVNQCLPINLSDKFSLIEQIHEKYPLVDKKDISITVKAFFDVLRESLLSGDIIHFNKTFSSMKLHIYKYHRDNKDHISVKVKLSTPVGVK